MERARHTLISWNLPWWLCARPGIDSVMYVISRIYASFYILYMMLFMCCVMMLILIDYVYVHSWLICSIMNMLICLITLV